MLKLIKYMIYFIYTYKERMEYAKSINNGCKTVIKRLSITGPVFARYPTQGAKRNYLTSEEFLELPQQISARGYSGTYHYNAETKRYEGEVEHNHRMPFKSNRLSQLRTAFVIALDEVQELDATISSITN